MTDMAI